MSDPKKPQQLPLYPTRDSLKQVIDEALAQLPIKDPNQLIAILSLQQNTLIKLLDAADS